LVRRSQQGDRDAFQALVEAAMGRSWALAWRLTGNRADAEDLVQETYMKAWSNISKFSGRSAFATWLYRIQFNCHCDGKRRQAGRKETPLDAPRAEDKPAFQPADPTPQPAARLEKAERLSCIRKTLDSLEPAYRQVLVLRHLEELSYEDIGRLMDIPVGTVAAWLFRARELFRAAYLRLYGETL